MMDRSTWCLGLLLMVALPITAVGQQQCQQAALLSEPAAKNLQLQVHEFEPGKYDLAIVIHGVADEIRRVSFSGAETACAYQPLAIVRGGDWGWHLLWAEQGKGIFYARMDGEAWVSSPRKKLGSLPVDDAQLHVSGMQLEINWMDAAGQRTSRISADEGRSWD